MSDVEQGGITAEPAASTEEEQALEQGQPEQANEVTPDGIPKKFLESSKYDVIQSYQELEKDRGRLASELGELRKSQEEMAEKYKQLETERFQAQQVQQPLPVQQETPQQEIDPLSVFDSKFDEDPKAAIREAVLRQQQLLESQIQQQRANIEASKASEFYFSQKESNPDFARREPVMQQLAQQYSHIIKPEFLNSADAIKVLDLMSRGADLDYYKKAAVEDTKKHRASQVEEKRRAQSESSNSQGDQIVTPKDMSHEEAMKYYEQRFGYSDKD